MAPSNCIPAQSPGRDATANASNDFRDEDLDGPVGYDSADQRNDITGMQALAMTPRRQPRGSLLPDPDGQHTRSRFAPRLTGEECSGTTEQLSKHAGAQV